MSKIMRKPAENKHLLHPISIEHIFRLSVLYICRVMKNFKRNVNIQIDFNRPVILRWIFRGKQYTSVITKTYYENQITESLFTTASKNHNANLAKLNIRIESGTKTTGNISKTINYRPCFR